MCIEMGLKSSEQIISILAKADALELYDLSNDRARTADDELH